ncbi:MAG: DUF903 domain-containing protein [Algoriphagus sp.]|uniref:DUF903 domain-containing protein n=1 Tax=Algoriphagus sp. TaxID=1872435 RepID=UPI00272F0D90|nr:DUF903 domain-containing protein [Algoriphagus sp.]MDP2043393.1 DUF903 domain-containing protein [Algoriphagus sp.]MDP3471967.1 DUF903 domain-containing protein [Algoriphagus sp.]
MRKLYFFFAFILFAACEELVDVKRIEGPCTIQLVKGGTITTQEAIEILKATGTITYRDQDGKLWSIPADEYLTYSCGN